MNLFNEYRHISKKSPGYILDNFELYGRLFHEITLSYNHSIKDIGFNIHFLHPSGAMISYEHKKTNINIYFELEKISGDEFDDFIFGNLTIKELIVSYCASNNCDLYDIIDKKSDFGNIYSSWNNYLDRINYEEKNLIYPYEINNISPILYKNNVIWFHNKSCTGKTYTAITMIKHYKQKIVYNPCFPGSCDYNALKLILELARDVTILIDDIQCDIERATELFDMVYNNISSLKLRNIVIVFVTWSSLFYDPRFQKYKNLIHSYLTNPEQYIDLLKEKINNPSLLDICGDNIALISAASKITVNSKIEMHKQLFEYFVHTKDSKKLRDIYVLSVLGIYEYETPSHLIQNHDISTNDIQTLKIHSNTYYAGHRKICTFIATYIETLDIELPDKKGLIKQYINTTANNEKWKKLKQLIGENTNNDTSSISSIWNTLYCFEDEIHQQTQKDPSWQNTPSSMYFVLSTASLLGVIEEYKHTVDCFADNFIVKENHIYLKYDQLKTTYDFEQIKSKMISEDMNSNSKFSYESGEDFNCQQAHKNWVLGLIIGLKDELLLYGKEYIYNAALNDLFSSQTLEGYWYPKRIPWVTARILIGLGKAGYSMNNHRIMKGVQYLVNSLSDHCYWEARTGGWNNIFETSSLCLEALSICGYDIKANKKVTNVVQYLEKYKKEWMSVNNEIDGTATACILLKLNGIKTNLLTYIRDLCNRKVYEIINTTYELDYNNLQSCNTTQIAYYIIELCWYILESDLSTLLDDFLSRSEYERKELELSKKMKIFISYSEDSKSHIERIRKISQYLLNLGHEVYFYADAPLGTNNMEFMQKAEICDVILIIGTKKYKEKAMNIRAGGVFFEANVCSVMFMNNNYDRIIPLAFDEFADSFPTPFNINKGLRVKRITTKILNDLENALQNRS